MFCSRSCLCIFWVTYAVTDTRHGWYHSIGRCCSHVSLQNSWHLVLTRSAWHNIISYKHYASCHCRKYITALNLKLDLFIFFIPMKVTLLIMCQIVTFKSVQCHPYLTYIFDFRHSGTLACRAERQSARMSKIKNVG